MKSLSVAIVDDEPLARLRLRRLLSPMDGIAVAGDYENGESLLASWSVRPADVVFMDVEMPEIDGLQLGRRLAPSPLIVFVTAYAQYAVDAFDLEAADYLVKPVCSERLRASLERVRRRIERDILPPAYPDRLALPLGRRTQLVGVGEIDCVLAQANYVEIHVGPRRFVLRKTLSDLQRVLDPARFARVHRSLIIRVDAVAELESIGSGRFRLRLGSGSRFVTGRTYRNQVRERFHLDADEREE
jgi:two-component system, LytTR family, response regulator